MTGLAYKQAAGLESDLLKCREAAERALGNSKPRVRALREVLSKYRQAIGEMDSRTGEGVPGWRWVIDADVSNYFGSISHIRLRAFLDLRIKEGMPP